ncbi:ATP-binding protein [Streptomyces sp. ISL-100]|uniref:ATP-binding protein n=1 Tax=Streptomyces sp. ISL-100 TaxID=2819173 RepID=UPI001BE70478|nr:ATP-binding protein [Streptomyces sp. ISL-100]MBT2397979.1 ATP-binding protein [Streptomyces sp. ISL-100]
MAKQQVFDQHPVSVRAAREFVTRTLTGWGVPDRRDDVRLCVSELATNALLHGGDRTCGFLVAMSINDAVLRVEVHDASSEMPRTRTPDDCSNTGRGLFLVAECADGWGVDETGPLKAVWAEFQAVHVRRPEVVSR